MRYILLIALMAAVSFASPVSDHGKLSVSGRKILDKNGNEYVLRGMSMFWDKWPDGSKFYNQGTINTLAGSSWNANVVRMAASQGQGSVQNAKNFMDWTSSAGIYVIIDWHYHDTDLNGAKTFFADVSNYAKTKSYTHVLYEIFNEPIKQTWASIKTYAEQVIDVIRANDPDGLIIVGNPNYSSDIGSAMANPITGNRAKNILYTLHFYTSDASHNAFQNNLKSAWCKDFPVFASEWGTSWANGGCGEDKDGSNPTNNCTQNWTLTNGWMSIVESIGISWANWSITDKSELAASGGLDNLTASGKYVQQIMKSRNGGGSITSANGSNNVNLTQVNVQSECSEGSGTKPGEKNGIVKVGGSANNAVNFVTMSGAKDSVTIGTSTKALQNTANTFSANYKLTDIPGPGAYRMRIRYGSSAAATVSWQGSGLESGTFQLPSTGGTSSLQNSEFIPITVTGNSSESPLNLTFNANGTNNFAFVNLLVQADPNPPTDPTDPTDPTPILSQAVFGNSLNAMQNGVNLQVASDASFKVFDLKGNAVRTLKFAQGSYTVSLGDLPKGLYVVKAQFGNQREVLYVPVR
jgi:endoglucanase